MNPKNLTTAENLLAVAEATSAALDQNLPFDEAQSKARLLELVQVIDYIVIGLIFAPVDASEIGSTMVLLSGWNRLLSKTIAKFSDCAVYLSECSVESSNRVMQALHQHGRANILKAAAEAVKTGECSASLDGCTWTISRTEAISDPYISESYEFKKSIALRKMFDESNQESVNGWTVVDDIDIALYNVGRFHQRTAEFIGKSLYCNDLDERIADLVRPCSMGKGIITAYEASPETDSHFIALASELSLGWRDDAGLHPEAAVGNYKVGEILEVGVLLLSLHLKHIKFCTVAKKIFPEISLMQSLSIWTTRSELVESISTLSDSTLSAGRVNSILDLMILKHSDSSYLENHPCLYIPLLIDMGGGMLLRPASSVAGNPLESLKTMLHWRVPNIMNSLAMPRENWLREHIYAMFCGNRYICVPSNIKLRSEGKILTDVDGAIFDRTTGELALFQLKWQDYSSLSKKALRSRAKNLAVEMNNWAEAVYKWLKNASALDVMQTFQLPIEQHAPKKIFLFGISRSVARTQGYGAMTKNEAIALCNFAQFTTARMEIGPISNVLGSLHERIFNEMDLIENFQPCPTAFTVMDGTRITLNDFFYVHKPPLKE